MTSPASVLIPRIYPFRRGGLIWIPDVLTSRQLAKVVRRVEFTTGLCWTTAPKSEDDLRMCCAIAAMPSPDRITPDTSLRLGIAAALAFLDGSMTGVGPRRGVFMLDPIPDQDLASMWPKLGTSWRDGAIIKRVL